MIIAIVKVMALRLWRDKGALLSTFALPPLVFFVFAAIFSGSAGGSLTVSVAIYDAVESQDSIAFSAGLSQQPDLITHTPAPTSEQAVTDLVQSGVVDAGIVIQHDLHDITQPPILIVTDPANSVAGNFLSGSLERSLAGQLPLVALQRDMKRTKDIIGTFTADQDARVAAAKTSTPTTAPQAGLVTVKELETGQGDVSLVTYYAGAIAFMFLLFSASHGAAMGSETEEAALVERLTIGGANVVRLTAGALLFLVIQGILQASVIFIGAHLVYDLGVGRNVLGFAAVVFVFALTAATLTMAINGLCATRKQALTVSSFVILIWSAVGGSMVPRFLMPTWLQDLGWLTPNTWAVEAYLQTVWRGASPKEIMLALLPLVTVSALCFCATVILARRRLRVKVARQ
ncbi:MAG: ABC transporter permease [Marinosulfonomonas sp.]